LRVFPGVSFSLSQPPSQYTRPPLDFGKPHLQSRRSKFLDQLLLSAHCGPWGLVRYSGWSDDCRMGLSPTRKRRLITAHAHSSHLACEVKRQVIGMPGGRNLVKWIGGKGNIENVSSDFSCSRARLCRETLFFTWWNSENRAFKLLYARHSPQDNRIYSPRLRRYSKKRCSNVRSNQAWT